MSSYRRRESRIYEKKSEDEREDTEKVRFSWNNVFE